MWKYSLCCWMSMACHSPGKINQLHFWLLNIKLASVWTSLADSILAIRLWSVGGKSYIRIISMLHQAEDKASCLACFRLYLWQNTTEWLNNHTYFNFWYPSICLYYTIHLSNILSSPEPLWPWYFTFSFLLKFTSHVPIICDKSHCVSVPLFESESSKILEMWLLPSSNSVSRYAEIFRLSQIQMCVR